MAKTAALIFGIAFLAAGVLGFVSAAAPNGLLFGLLHVNPAHNVVHLLTGALGLVAGLTSLHASRVFFQVLGVGYTLVAVLGFVHGNEPIFGFLANNIADSWFHLVVAAASLFLGFGSLNTPSYATARQ